MRVRMMRTLSALVLLAPAIGATGCMSPKHKCPLGEGGYYCASMRETYEAARAGGGDAENVLAAPGMGAEGNAPGAGRLDIPSGRHHLAGPVYIPAKPFRLWVAPWTDANGLVHSGEYLYFATPARWSYGPLALPGAASGVMGPAAPENLGFNPVPVGTSTPQQAADPNSVTPPAQRLVSQPINGG